MYAKSSPWGLAPNGLYRGDSDSSTCAPSRSVSEFSSVPTARRGMSPDVVEASQSGIWEPEQAAMTVASYLSFGLLDRYRNAESAAGMSKRAADGINKRRGRRNMPSLAWSYRLHTLATRHAKGIAEGQRRPTPQKDSLPTVQNMFSANIGNVRELVHVTHSQGEHVSLEVASQWFAESKSDQYTAIGIGAAQASGGRWIFVAYMITENPEWKHQFYSIERIGERPHDSVFWKQVVV